MKLALFALLISLNALAANVVSSGVETGTFTNSHMKVVQSAPTTANVTESAGVDATCSFNYGSDVSGQVYIGTGSSNLTTGPYCEITFATAYDVPPVCVLSPVDDTSDANVSVSTTETGLSIRFSSAPAILTPFYFNYICIQTP